MRKKIYILLFASVFSVTMFAQTSKADQLFDNWEYYEAAQLYKTEAEKNPSADTYYKLGECYRKMNSYKKEQQAAYDKVNAYGTYRIPEFYLNYGQVLKSNGNYDQAKVAFDKYSSLMPSDSRGQYYSESIDIVNEDRKSDAPVIMTNVQAVNSKDADFSPVYFKDGIVFTSSRDNARHHKTYPWTGNNYLDLYYAKKGSKVNEFSGVEPFEGKKNNKKFHDGPASFSKNFDTIYISRVEKYLKGKMKKDLKIQRNKIFIAVNKDDKWQKAEPFEYNSDLYSVANPYLSPDGSKLYFISDMPGGFGNADIYYCNRQGSGWGAPINMGPSVNTFGNERYPYVDPTGNFYFSSDGYQGLGGMDICVALNENSSLQKAKPLKYPMNSTYDDNGILFLQDGKVGYITSNRSGAAAGEGDDDIMSFDFSNTDLIASEYTIGYEPKVEEVVEVVPETEPVIERVVIVPGDKKVYFDFDKYEIRYDAVSTLDSIVKFMNAFPELHLTLGGHCDSRGDYQYNIYLSDNRNNSVINYLGTKGVNKDRIDAKAYGYTQLVNKCKKGVKCSEAQHQLNRNVHFHFDQLAIEVTKPVNNTPVVISEKEHIVEKDETLYSISKLYDASIEDLKKINKLDNETIVVGQVLIVGL